MLLLISVLTFVVLFVILYMVFANIAVNRETISLRLKALESITTDRSDIDDELAKPFAQRVVSPLTANLAGILAHITPRSLRKMAADKIAAAGGFGGLSPNEFLLYSLTLSVVLPMVAGSIMVSVKAPSNKVLGTVLLSFSFGAAFPFFLLTRKIAERKRSIQKDLPDVLDLLTVSVEAGLGFDGALAKLSEKMKGALVEEFNRVLQEIRIGVTRREALYGMGQRCDVPDLSLFTTSLVQADQLGVSIGNVLRIQSVAMREKRRQRAKEQAMKAPIKMLIPMVLFIFPTIFIVLLGPAAIRLMSNLLAR